MKVISLDQSTLKTGYAVFIGDKLKRHGVIDISKIKDIDMRLKQMFLAVDELIQKEKPDTIVLEGVAMQRDAQAVIKLGRLQGLIMSCAIRREIPVSLYLPSHWRKILGIKQGGGIKRAQLKEEAISIVNHTYKIDPTEDEAEAITIGLAYIKEQNDLKGEEENGKESKKRRSKKGSGTESAC